MASLQTPEYHPFQQINKIILTDSFVPEDGNRMQPPTPPPHPTPFNQKRKTDMSNHNKTSAAKWAFLITVRQPPLEGPPFLDINQCFMDWFLHSLFNYSYLFIYLTTEDFFVRYNHFFVGNHSLLPLCHFFLYFLVITLFLCSVTSKWKLREKSSSGPFTTHNN